MRGSLARRACLLTALLLAQPVFAQEAPEWLTRMDSALSGLDYHGDLVYAHGSQIETLRVFHAAGPDVERERLIAVSGAAREIVRVGGQVTAIGTGPRPTIYGDPALQPRLIGSLPTADPARLQAHYALAVSGVERVAGLNAQIIEIQPRDAYRYGFRLWLDLDSGMLLKSVRFGADGRPVEQLMFTRIALRERPSDADLAGSQQTGAMPATPLPSFPLPPGATGWQVVDPPAGFALAAQQPPASNDGNEHLVYTDGMASVSVYIEPVTSEHHAFSGPASRGAVNLYGRIVDARQITAVGDVAAYQITVLGDVPAATVERFAQNVAGITAPGGG
jgi:sigma-E factor negative regulatory protein RseB